MRGIFFFLFICLLYLTSCTKNHAVTDSDIVNVTEIAIEQQIPKALLQKLDEKFSEEFKTAPPIYTFLPIQVGIWSDQADVLRRSTVYSFPKGGGEIDLRDLISGSGSFYLYFPEAQFSKENDLLHLFFVSHSPQVTIDGESFGLGCGKWTDLKSKFSDLKKRDYLKLNTHDLRYLRVVAGIYVFVFKNQKNIFLTQLTVKDSRHASELCTEVIEDGSK